MLTVEQVAEMAGLKPATIRAYVAKNWPPKNPLPKPCSDLNEFEYTPGRNPLWDEREIEEWLERRAVLAISPVVLHEQDMTWLREAFARFEASGDPDRSENGRLLLSLLGQYVFPDNGGCVTEHLWREAVASLFPEKKEDHQ